MSVMGITGQQSQAELPLMTNNMETVLQNLEIESRTTRLQTLGERIEGHVVPLHNYLKYDKTTFTGKPTGAAVLVNQCPNLAVIDVDIRKDLTEQRKEEVRQSFLKRLDKSTEELIVVKTGSGGLHIYCNLGGMYVSSNRMVKCFSTDEYEVDLMSSVDVDSKSLIVLPGSKTRKSGRDPMTHYDFLRGSLSSHVERDVRIVLMTLDIKIKVEQDVDVEHIIETHSRVNAPEELIDALINGLVGLEIHNDGACRKIKDEINMFTLFQAINALPFDRIEEAYTKVETECNLTTSATANFSVAKLRYSHLSTSPYVLVKIMRIWRPEYYSQHIDHLIQKPFTMRTIDMRDSFLLRDIRKKAENREYTKGLNEVAEDLSRIMRYVDDGKMPALLKQYNTFLNTYELKWVLDKDMTKTLKSIGLWKQDGHQVTAYDALKNHMSEFSVNGVKFYSKDPTVVSTFFGYKYSVHEVVDDLVIEPFIRFVKEIICDSNDEVVEYVLNWFAWIIQHPGKKAETSLVLKGLQGIGKNVFTDVLCELLSGYSGKNITDINELTGTFNSVVESKILLILNELRNVGDDRLANFNALKSIISDATIRINEKQEPRRTAENVANFIFCTNNSYPIKVEKGDRRYVVLNVSGKYKGDFDYFGKLKGGFTQDFYEELMTYFTLRDVSNFQVRVIPMTDAKRALVEASTKPIDEWISDHYTELTSEHGMPKAKALETKPEDIKLKCFRLDLSDNCVEWQPRIQGVCVRSLKLKADRWSLYSQTE